MTETIHFGVPIIGLPIFLDQYTNIDAVIAKGIGKRVDINSDTPMNLKNAINDIISDPK